MLGTDAEDQKNCCAREWTDHSLGKNDFVQWTGRMHLFELYSQSFSFSILKSSFKPELSAILGATSLLLRQRLNTAMGVWVSP